MSIDWELLRVLREPQEPTVEPCSKDAGCVQATATGVALDAVYKAMEKPPGYTTVCAWCKKVRQADGTWKEPVGVIAGKITHGICPECLDKELAEIMRERKDHESTEHS